MKFFIYLILSCLFFLSCEPGGPGSKSYKDPQGAIQELQQSYKEITMEGYYTIEIPEQIDESEEKNANAAFQYIDEEYKFGILIVNEDINGAKDAMENLNPELIESNAGNGFIDKYLQFQINTLKNVITEYDYFMVEPTMICQRDARTYEITAKLKDDPNRLTFTGTVVEGRSQVYYIYIFYPAEKQEDYRPIKDHILESFTLNETHYNVETEEVEEIISPEIPNENYDEYDEEEYDEDFDEEAYEEYIEEAVMNGLRPKQSKRTRKRKVD